MFKVLKFIVISVVCLIIMGASVLYGFSSLFAPPNMDETLIPEAASQFYDINGNAIYTTLSEERRIPVTIDKIPIENAGKLLFFTSKSEDLLFTFLTI